MIINIDDEFKYCLPQLEDVTYNSLKQQVINEGCRDPLVLWKGFLIDGHNRYKICTENNIEFRVVDYTDKFKSRDEVMLWIITTQDSRRNLTDEQAYYYRGKRYDLEKKCVGAPEGNDNASQKQRGNSYHVENENKNNDIKRTRDKIAEEYNVSSKTIQNDMNASRAIDLIGETSPEAKQKILSGKANINKKELEKLSHKSPEIIKSVAIKIGNGTYMKEKQKPSEVKQVDDTNKTESSNTGRYSFVMGGVVTLSDTIKMVSGDIKKHLKEITKASEREQISKKIREQVNELENLLKLF